MFCPNYKNKEVKDGFNEIVEALGGKPLTDEEFRSSDLRNKRTGADYSAMESAYKMYHRNGGNMPDLAPNGQPSVLFLTLLEHFGNRADAIVAKSNVYSDEFINWFGDWGRFKTIDTKNNLFTPTGEVNWNYFELLLNLYHNNQPDSMFSHGRYTLATRPENHFAGEKNTLNHIKFVTQSMLNLLEGKYDMDLPFVSEARASMQNQKDLMVLAAMFHDAAKPYRHGDIHGWESADILRDLLGIDYNNRVAEWAVRHHMPMPFSHKAEFSLSNPEAIEVAKNIARDARRIGIDANTAINAFVLINAADVINGRELNVDDNWAKKAGEEGLKKYGGDISVKNVLSVELKEKVALLKKAFDEIKDEDFGDTAYNYSHQERFDYNAFPEGGRLDKKLPYLNNTEYTGVSKVVDENGEPLVVWHGNRTNDKISEFLKSKIGSEHKKIIDGFWFITNKNLAKEEYAAKYKDFKFVGYGEVLPVYLNLKNPRIDKQGGLRTEDSPYGKMDIADERFLDFIDRVQQNSEQNDGFILDVVDSDGGADPFYQSIQKQLIAKNSNQIKHVENLGTFNPDDANMYHVKISAGAEKVAKQFGIDVQFAASSGENLFGITGFLKLVNNNAVSSSEILNVVLSNKAISFQNRNVAEIVKYHDVPVRFAELEDDTIATTVHNSNTGEVYILINKNHIGRLSNRLMADSILHEVIHAVTVKAIDNAETLTESRFARSNKKLFDLLSNSLPESQFSRTHVDEGFHILDDEKEFAAYFISDAEARSFVFDAVNALDVAKYGKFGAALSNFINSIVNLFTDKPLIKTNKSLLRDYKKNFLDHLNNVPQIVQGNIKSKELFDAIYNSTDDIVIKNDALYEDMHLAKIMFNNMLRSDAKKVDIKPAVTDEYIAKLLLTRRKMIEHSNSSKEDIIKTSQMLETQAESLLSDSMIEKWEGIVSIVNQLIPQVLSDYLYVKKLSSVSPDDFIEIVHTNFNTYDVLATDLADLLSQLDFKNDLVHALGISGDQEKVTEFLSGPYNDIIDQLSKINSLYKKLEYTIKQLRQNTTAAILEDIADAVHDPTMEKYIANLNKTESDISSFTRLWGAMDSATDNGIRALYHIVEKANKEADLETYDRVVDLLELASKVKKRDLKKLYETLDDGTTSGYLIRDLNFGKFYAAYDQALIDINRKVNKEFDLHIADDNRLPPNEEAARKRWNDLRNDWLSANCHRKFKNEYYKALGDLPELARKRLSEINNAIFSINMLPGVIDKKTFGDDYPHYEVLDDDMYERLQNLRTLKKELYSLYYDNGKKKTGEDLYIAEELLKYYKKLYDGSSAQSRFVKDRKAWINSLKRELMQCGGQEAVDAFGNEDFEELDKYIDSHPEFNIKRWRKWNERNSKFQFISNGDEDGKGTLINDDVMREYGEEKPYYGPEEEAISDQISDLMRPYYMSNGFINNKKMSRAIKKEIIELLLKLSKLRKKITDKNPALKKQALRYGAIINKYFNFEETLEFKELKEQIRNKIVEQYGYFNPDVYYRVLQQYGTAWFDRSTGSYTNFRPYKWYTKAVAKNKYKYMEWVPGDNFTDLDSSVEFKNPLYKAEYGVSYVPLESKYKNEKYSEITGDLKQLHEEIASILKDANAKMKNRVYVDNYLLPLITGSMYKRMKAHHSRKDKWHAFKEYILEQLGFTPTPQNETVYGAEYEDRGDDDSGRGVVTLSEKRKKLGLLKNKPDGHPLHMIPQYYTVKKNPEHISQDIIGITMEYFNMAARYKNKSDIKNQCETIVDMLENRQYVKTSSSGSEEITSGDETNAFKAARKFLDMNLYDIRREKVDFAVGKNYDFLRTSLLLARYTTANNLGANPKVALTGFLTTMWSHLINAVSGNGYGFKDAHDGGKEVLWFALKTACTFGARAIENRLSNDDIVVIAEYYNVSDQLQRKYKNQNRNAFVNAVYRNSVFGLLSSVDFISKSCIALSTLYSFRLVDGEFVTEDLIYRNAAMKPKDLRESYLLDALKKYKKAPTLRSFIKVVDHKFTVTDHKDAYDKVEYLVRSRIEKTAERADGMATMAQKAAITQSWIGALILIHRQYLPLMIQERLSDPVYDYDMQMIKNGQFKVFYRYLAAIARGSLIGGAAAGSLGGFFIFGAPGAFIGAAAGAAYGYKNSIKNGKKSIKQTEREMFDYTKSDDFEETLNAIYNKRAVRQIKAELLIFNLILSPLINGLCKYADDPENKDSKFLQFMCLVLRQFQWEAYNPYRFIDIFNNVKNVTAATGSGDVVQDLGNMISAEATYATQLILPRTASDLFSIQSLSDTIENPWLKKVKSGAYKDKTKIERSVAKALPWSNWWEQSLDSKAKRKWIEGKTMGIDKDESSVYYNVYKKLK